MSEHAAEAAGQQPEDRQEKWADLAPDASDREELAPPVDEETAPGSLGGDNGGG